MYIITVVRRSRHKDYEFKASLGYPEKLTRITPPNLVRNWMMKFTAGHFLTDTWERIDDGLEE